MSKYKPSVKHEFSAKIAFTLNFSPSTSRVVYKSRACSSKRKKMTPRKTRAFAWLPKGSFAAPPEERLEPGKKSVSRVAKQTKRNSIATVELNMPNKKSKPNNTKKRQGTSQTQKENTSSSKENKSVFSASLYSRKEGAVRKPVTYVLSDEEDSMPSMKQNASGSADFYDFPPIEIDSSVIDLNEDIIELPTVQEVTQPEENLLASVILPPLISKFDKSSVNPIISAQSNSNVENVDTIIDKFLESDDKSFHESHNNSNSEFLANVDELLSNSLEIGEASNFCTDGNALATSSVTNEFSRVNNIKKGTPELDSLIEVIDLSSRDCSLSVIDISDSSPKNAQGKSATSEQCDSSTKPNLGDCPICLEPIGSQAVASTFCGHIFCDPCIRNCVRNTKKCPNCRKTLNLKQIHPLFI